MFNRILKWLITIFGGAVGYGIYLLTKTFIESDFFVQKTGMNINVDLTSFNGILIGVLFALVFGTIFFKLTPLIRKQGTRVADTIGDDLREVSANDLMMGIVGLIVGLIIAVLITQIFKPIANPYIYFAAVFITYLTFIFLGLVIANKKGKEILSQIINFSRNESKQEDKSESKITFIKGRKKHDGSIPKIFDTSVIIDGRIAEIIKTGFLEGPIVIPEFVLVELRHIADSSDELKRLRGRRGLDILNKIQETYGIEIYGTDGEKSLAEIPEVDVKLLKLAQIMNGKVVTNDFNLNKVANINGISVLNINELANTLKPVAIPGEMMNVNPVKQGKNASQAIAYLDDGTMIVVEDGRKSIGKNVDVIVTSIIQTAAGRMIFTKLK